eukprot:TRINITY_DN3236_c0_g1_i2.p1 TRINITY_DN3236_c0_g1~~TRINITY_DN3236_c0_g1_i2.p1  ORF type:complete len:437 (+),score=57.71 TRINITY_DN3236_c0_g1_i2:196-1506(+)
MNSNQQLVSSPLLNTAVAISQSASPAQLQHLFENLPIDVQYALMKSEDMQPSLPLTGTSQTNVQYFLPQNVAVENLRKISQPENLRNISPVSVAGGVGVQQFGNLWSRPQDFDNVLLQQNYNIRGNSSSGVQQNNTVLSPSTWQTYSNNFSQLYAPPQNQFPSPLFTNTYNSNNAAVGNNILPLLNQVSLNSNLNNQFKQVQQQQQKQQQQSRNPRKVRQQEQLSANRERTIYVSEVEHNVTEAEIAAVFAECGEIVDVRLCGDAHSKMRFSFVEFSEESCSAAIPEALKLNNFLMNGFPIRVQRSKTAIVPVKRELLPQNEDEMLRCSRTMYACNIDRRFTQQDVVAFFQTLVADESMGADGRVARIKMMNDSTHQTQIAFVQFYTDESIASALDKCQGALMGCLPLRVSPSKTPIRTAQEERSLREARQIGFAK